MKNNDEFLDGMYKKAEQYSTHKYDVDGFTHATTDFIKKYAGATIAALLIIIAVPSLYIGLSTGQASMIEQSATFTIVQPPENSARAAAFSADAGAGNIDATIYSQDSVAFDSLAASPLMPLTVSTITDAADTVVLATVKKIKDSVYDNDVDNNMSTTVVFQVNDVIKGELDKKTFSVKVNGGYDEKNNNFIPYEATFEKKETAILCLSKAADDTYALTFSSNGKFCQTEQPGFFQDTLGNTTSVTELEKIIN